MKKKTNILFLLAAALLLAACTQDEYTAATQGEPLEFRAVIGNTSGTSTRATVDNSFDTGDRIALDIRGDNNPKTYEYRDGRFIAADPNDALYHDYAAEGGTSIKAVYPATHSDVLRSAGFTYTVPTDQTATGYEEADVLYANAFIYEEKTPLQFQHATAKVVVNIRNSSYTEGAEIEGVALNGLYAQAEIIFGDYFFFYQMSGTTNIQTHRADTPASGAAATFEALVIPGQTISSGTTFATITVTKDGSKKTLTYSPDKDITFTQGTRHTFNLTLTQYGIVGDITVDNINWETGASGSGTLEMGSGDGYTYTETGGVRSYTVTSDAGLKAWAEYVLAGNWNTNCTLTQNITLTGENNWTAIGNEDYPYTGTFDGNGKTITGLTISAGSSYNQGLIGHLGSGGRVQNLKLENVSISGKSRTGGIVGYNNGGTVSGCSVTIANSITGDYCVGGIVGDNESGTVSGCSVTMAAEKTVSGNNQIGGVVGRNGGTVTACYFTGTVSCSSSIAGGVAGINNPNATITACYATGSVSGSTAGGVVGQNNSSATITACYYYNNANQGVGNNFGSGTVEATKVDGSNVTWNETALNGMNAELTDMNIDWRYENNPDGTPPLVLVYNQTE